MIYAKQKGTRAAPLRLGQLVTHATYGVCAVTEAPAAGGDRVAVTTEDGRPVKVPRHELTAAAGDGWEVLGAADRRLIVDLHDRLLSRDYYKCASPLCPLFLKNPVPKAPFADVILFLSFLMHLSRASAHHGRGPGGGWFYCSTQRAEEHFGYGRRKQNHILNGLAARGHLKYGRSRRRRIILINYCKLLADVADSRG